MALSTRSRPTEISVRYQLVGNNNTGFNVYDRSWNLKSTGQWKYSPSDGNGVPAQFKVGATWKIKSDEVNAANGIIWKRSGTAKIVAQENVTTRAGTFDTFKIEAAVSAQRTNDPNLKNEITSQTWYAPAVDHWVKRVAVVRSNGHLRENNTFELVEYGRKAAP